ncbi:glutaredoxin family protein [Alteromonas sp. ASW11-130]|uniref:glutaredoxin family protein n=1 Tax=Alteromonas sp. ASW11-130 TaxID=3015775 RepID=UPI0022426004|nr:glutaredoxin family protein [Alteromonas sp. ASW11-130]MCW8092303.1 glutaredoxin family protein [Alteromonas sp. ASW11-130]
MLRLVLYTGPDCHLCNDALDVIAQLKQPVMVEKVNIRDSTELYHLYGARIPVVKRKDTGAELGWPFNVDSLEQYIK